MVHISHQKHFVRYCIYCVVIICHCYYCSEVSCREGPGVLKIYLDSKVFLYHTKCSIPKPKTSMGACKQLKIRKMKRLLCFSRLTPRLICSDNDRQGHWWRQLKLLLLLPLLKIKSNGLVIWNFFEIFNQIWSFFRHFTHFNGQVAKQKEINDVVSKCVVNTPDSEIYRGVCLSAINGFCPSTIKRSQNLSHISKAEEMIFWDGQYYNLEDRF